MIKKYNEFINEGMMSKMWRELDGTETRKEEEEIHVDVDIYGVDEHHSFTDANGKFHKNGYKITKIDEDEKCNPILKKLIYKLIEVRGEECSLNDIDVSNLNSIKYLFSNDFGVRNFNGDISGWDVSNIIDFSYLFYNSNFTGKNCDLNKWKICSDESKNINMDGMFNLSKFEGDISDWDVSRVSSMYLMFLNCKTFNGDLSKWDVSNCTMFCAMFRNSGFTGENGDIGCWKFNTGEKIINFKGMFRHTKLNIDLDLSKWETGENKIICIDMFDGCHIPEENKPKFARYL